MASFRQRLGLSNSTLLAASPAVLIVVICGVFPLAWLASTILLNPDVYRELHIDSFRAQLLARTIGYNGAAAVLATLMGLPAGYVLGRGRGLAARLLWVVLPAALLLPSLSYAYGWSQFVRLVHGWAYDNYGISLMPRPARAGDVFRCIWSLAAWLWAVPAGLIGLALRRMDPLVQQQALLDGALRRFTLRQLAGPILASMAIVTVLASQEFAVYEPTGISVVATEVRMVFDTGAVSSPNNSIAVPLGGGEGKSSPDQPARAAAALTTALPLLVVTSLLAIIAAWGARRGSATESLAVGDWPRVLDVSRWTIGLTILLILLNIGVPVWALFKSLRATMSPERIAKEFGPQTNGAIFVGSVAGLIALVAALSAAACWVRGLLGTAGIVFLVGGQLLAIALIRIFNRPGLVWAYDIWVVPAIAYVGRFGWLALAAGRSTWSPPWRELRSVAAVDGASTIRTAMSVIWPIAWPTLVAGGLLVGALSLTEVPATVLIMPQQPQVLTPLLMTWVHTARYDPMIEASLLMMAMVLIPGVAAVVLTTIGARIARRGLTTMSPGGATDRSPRRKSWESK
jgi:ABC-type Fe3+ transport system permease subunit